MPLGDELATDAFERTHGSDPFIAKVSIRAVKRRHTGRERRPVSAIGAAPANANVVAAETQGSPIRSDRPSIALAPGYSAAGIPPSQAHAESVAAEATARRPASHAVGTPLSPR